MVQKFFRKAFGLYAGEGQQALRFARMAVLWAFGSACLDTLSDGLFIEKIGASFFPRVYCFVAIAMLGISSLVLYSLKKLSPHRILSFAIGGGIVLCGLAALILSSTTPPLSFWYGLKIGSKVFFTVMISCSWTFIDQYHDLQDAKRVYALYGGSYFLGTILAGSAIHWLLDVFGFSGLLLLAALFLAGSLREVRAISQKHSPLHDDSVEGSLSSSRDSMATVCKLILRSPFALLLLLMSLATQLLITVTEFNYMETFGWVFQSSSSSGEEEITSFLGSCRALIALGNLFVGVFFYNRWVRKFGLHNILLVTPLFFFGVYSFWIFHDALTLAVLGLCAVDGILFTMEDTSFNLLANAVPVRLRSRVRIVNDSFFEPIGMLLSALLLLSFEMNSHWMGMVLTILFLAVSLGLRSLYSKAIFINLKDNALHFERKLVEWFSFASKKEQKQMRQDLFSSLSSPSEEVRLLAIEGVLGLQEKDFLPKAISSARSLGTSGKIHFLLLVDQSEHASDPLVVEELQRWLKYSESPELSKWISLSLAKRGDLAETSRVEDLRHSDPFLRGAALLTWQKSAQEGKELLEEMLRSPHIDEVKIALDVLAEKEPWTHLETTLSFLAHPSLFVKRAAAQCILKGVGVDHGSLLPKLIQELEKTRDNSLRLTLLSAIGKIAKLLQSMIPVDLKQLLLTSIHFRPNERRKTEEVLAAVGKEIVLPLLSFTQDIALPERSRLLASKVLSRLNVQELQAHLIDILDIEIERAYFYFYFAQTIQAQYPLYDLRMLQNALFTGYQSIIDFIIHLLGTSGSLEDPDLLVRSLHSRNPKTRAHAVESLEKTCDARIFRLIAPLVDDLPLEEKMAACLRWRADYPQLSLQELLEQLDRSPSIFDKAVSARLKATLKTPLWREQLLNQTKGEESHFTEYAHELLGK